MKTLNVRRGFSMKISIQMYLTVKYRFENSILLDFKYISCMRVK